MTKDHVARLTEAFVSEYTDTEIDPRLFFDWWADRRRLGAALADKLWRAVATALAPTYPHLLKRRRRSVRRR